MPVPQRIAIITGAGGGIGRATAVELNGRGFTTVLVGRSQKTLDETAKLVRDPLVVAADITRLADIDRIVEQTLSRYGRIDAVINNAGAATVASIEQTTPQIWQEMIDTNLSAPFHLCRAVWPTFTKQRGGVIVNVSSLAARDPFEGFAAYGAAKAGLNLLGLSLARQGKAIGVRVHTVAPGAVETSMLRGAFSTDVLPTERTLAPQDVARVIAQCVTGDLECTSGEVIWVSRS
jgi:3-oxoacyl-[acyl-carrier protein] reductase